MAWTRSCSRLRSTPNDTACWGCTRHVAKVASHQMLFFFFFSLLFACNGTRMKHGHFLLCYHQDRGWQARQLLYWRVRALKAAQAAQWTASACMCGRHIGSSPKFVHFRTFGLCQVCFATVIDLSGRAVRCSICMATRVPLIPKRELCCTSCSTCAKTLPPFHLRILSRYLMVRIAKSSQVRYWMAHYIIKGAY